MKVQAIWNDVVLAESEQTVVVEGNHYFPLDAIKREFLLESKRVSVCPWKGLASYYDVVVGDDVNPAAAWYYPEPEPAAREIKNHVAFWNGVRVQTVDASAA